MPTKERFRECFANSNRQLYFISANIRHGKLPTAAKDLSKEEIRQAIWFFLHRLIYQNSTHVMCLTEADSLTDDMIDELMIPGQLHIFRLKHGLAPSAVCVRGDKTASIELLHSNYHDARRDSQHGPHWATIGLQCP